MVYAIVAIFFDESLSIQFFVETLNVMTNIVADICMDNDCSIKKQLSALPQVNNYRASKACSKIR